MLRFEWSAFITPDVVARVASEAGVPTAAVEELRPLLSRIAAHTGGLPFVAAEPSMTERTNRGLALLGEAIAHTAAEAGVSHDTTGYVTADPGSGRYARRIVALDRVNVNSADSQELAALPGVTASLAGELIDERRRGGRFTDVRNLERRVDGIGPVKARAIAAAVAFDGARDTRRAALDAHGDLGVNLRTLMALQPDPAPAAALPRAIEMVLTACATTPHPSARNRTLRGPATAVPQPQTTASWIGELWSDDYWKVLPELLSGAAQSIDVCMFHIALPKETHPTFGLLDALRQAHQRGVAVRVLVDSDQKTDPYRSTVINAPAKKFLQDAGIACRSDVTDRLLHSKYLILDRELVILGSHNWSAGSYFGFDDLTLVIAAAELAAGLGARFETLWAAGT